MRRDGRVRPAIDRERIIVTVGKVARPERAGTAHRRRHAQSSAVRLLS